MTIGDSKTAGGLWQPVLVASLNNAGTCKLWQERPSKIAVGGTTVEYWATNIATWLASAVGTPDYVLINLGVNEMASLPAEATWENNYQIVIDAVKTKYPQALIWLVRPWKRGYTAAANTIAGWIDTIVSSNLGVVYVGPDERIWLEGGDDGATMTTDGIHYSDAGVVEASNQWSTILNAL